MLGVLFYLELPLFCQQIPDTPCNVFRNYFMAKLYMNKRVCRKAKNRGKCKTARFPFCIFLEKELRQLFLRVLSLLVFLGRVAFSINSSVTWRSHGDRFSHCPQSHSNPGVMFVLPLTKAKILDYSTVSAINLVFPLFKTINLGCTVIMFLQKSLQLKPFQKVKN